MIQIRISQFKKILISYVSWSPNFVLLFFQGYLFLGPAFHGRNIILSRIRFTYQTDYFNHSSFWRSAHIMLILFTPQISPVRWQIMLILFTPKISPVRWHIMLILFTPQISPVRWHIMLILFTPQISPVRWHIMLILFTTQISPVWWHIMLILLNL
jgi:hypothetical protein